MTAAFQLDESIFLKLEILYLIKLLEKNTKGTITQHPEGIKIGFSSDAGIRLSRFFANPINTNTRPAQLYFENDQHEPDYLATAFYLLNSIQEYDNTNLDSLARFKFEGSYQQLNSCSKENIVQHCFDKIAEKLKIGINGTPTTFFLSHDIDTVFESLLQDGFNVIKKGRFDIFLQLLFRVAIGRPDWLNMDLVMKIESEYDCVSTFFWIVNKGKAGNNLANADYNFQNAKMQKIVKSVVKNGFENGLHKSISSESFKQELSKFNPTPIANRYHYLKFNLPDAYNALEESGLRLDASLGYSEQFGFRNNYGLPFNPFNIENRTPYSFVEVPLHVMDTTLFKNKKLSIEEKQNDVFDFFERNKTNCVLSVLWHNNFFSNYKYKGYLQFYKNILAYIKENNLKTTTHQDILNNYAL